MPKRKNIEKNENYDAKRIDSSSHTRKTNEQFIAVIKVYKSHYCQILIQLGVFTFNNDFQNVHLDW